MIKIKDLIINENEIVYIEEFDAQSLGIMFKGKDKAIFVDAHLEDIEWNYPSKEIEYLYKRNEELEKDYTNISNDYQRLLNRNEELEEENKELKERIDKAIVYIEEHSLNFNGECEIDLEVEECKDLIKILKGSEE